jgi:hypothetical protein
MTSRTLKDVTASIHQRLQNLRDTRQDFQSALLRGGPDDSSADRGAAHEAPPRGLHVLGLASG